jgi:hypothetical protein
VSFLKLFPFQLVFLKKSPIFSNFFHLPVKTKQGACLSIHRINDTDQKKFDLFECLKFDIMAIDIFQSSMVDKNIAEYEIAILDGAGISFRHLMKFIGSLLHLKVFFEFVQTCVPYYLKEIHVINVSSIVKSIYSLIQPFINSKTAIIFHTSHEQLIDIFDKEVLPEEYGGTLGKIPELNKAYLDKLEKNANVLKQYNFTK